MISPGSTLRWLCSQGVYGRALNVASNGYARALTLASSLLEFAVAALVILYGPRSSASIATAESTRGEDQPASHPKVALTP